MGYWSQWLKVNHPLEFWAVSLMTCKDEEKINRLSEINKIGNIKVVPPDINNSKITFEISKGKNSIYWSIGSIKWVGDKAVEEITKEREKNGDYFSFEDFYSRVNKTVVNKRVICNLILSGAFDEVEKVQRSSDRYRILVKLYGDEKIPTDLDDKEKIWKDYYWEIKSKESCGYGYIDTESIFKQSIFFGKQKYADSYYLFSEDMLDKNVVVCGVLISFNERKSKNGKFCQIQLDNNNDIIFITVWAETYEEYKDIISDSKNKLVVINGNIRYDSWRKTNVIHTDKKSKIQVF
jgi:DNA polymerase III alpha subunit